MNSNTQTISFDSALRSAEMQLRLGNDHQLRNAAYLPVSDIARPAQLEQWLDRTQIAFAGMDRRSAAAYFLSIFIWRLGNILGAVYLLNAPTPQLDAANLSAVQYGYGGRSEPNYGFRFSPSGFAGPRDAAVLAASLVAIHTPLIAALHQMANVSEKALWRLVTDGISFGLLNHAKAFGGLEQASAEAQAICAAAPLHNKQWHFADVALRAGPERFRMRGGCCRLYHTAGGDYCSTCVVIPEAERIARITRARGGAPKA